MVKYYVSADHFIRSELIWRHCSSYEGNKRSNKLHSMYFLFSVTSRVIWCITCWYWDAFEIHPLPRLGPYLHVPHFGVLWDKLCSDTLQIIYNLIQCDKTCNLMFYLLRFVYFLDFTIINLVFTPIYPNNLEITSAKGASTWFSIRTPYPVIFKKKYISTL